MYVPVVLGTAREGRESEKVANFVLGEVKAHGLDTELLDVRDFRLKATDNAKSSKEARLFSGKVSRAAGFVIVSPEYNHGCPGELKMMLDMLYGEYFGKPVGLCGVSAGPLGGARMVQQLRLVCLGLKMFPLSEVVYFPFVKALFDDKGVIKDRMYGGLVKKLLDQLVVYAEKLSEKG